MDKNISRLIKKTSLDILVDFDRFCKEHNLRYCITFGTLLGAIRHKGFIPWDDDIDVDMPISDYIRFRKYWLKYGDKEKYFLQTKNTDPKLPYPYYRLRLNNTASIDSGYETFHLHWGLPLDIFPVYNLPKNKFMQKVQRKLFVLTTICSNYDWVHKDAKCIPSFFCRIMALLCLQGLSVISYFSKSSSVYYPYGYPNRQEGKKELWSNTTPIMFEGIEFQAHSNPHEYLVWQYGEDYMTPPPEDQRNGHPSGIIDFEHDGSYYTNYFVRNK